MVLSEVYLSIAPLRSCGRRQLAAAAHCNVPLYRGMLRLAEGKGSQTAASTAFMTCSYTAGRSSNKSWYAALASPC